MDINIIKKVLLSCKKEIIIKFIVSAFLRGSLLILPILYGLAVNYISAKDYRMAYIMIILSIIVNLICRLADSYNNSSWFRLYNLIYNKLTKNSLDYTYRNSLYSLSRISLGEYSNIFNSDISIISSFWSSSIIRIIQVLEFVFIFVYFFKINLYIGLITIIVSAVVLYALLRYGTWIEELKKNEKDTYDKKTGILQEIFLGIKEIKGFNIIASINKRANKVNDEYLDAVYHANVDYFNKKSALLFFIETFRFILFIYGIYLISIGQMEIGVLLIIYNYYTKLIENLNEVSNINMEYRNLTSSVNRFNRLIEYSGGQNRKDKDLNSDPLGKIVFDKVLYGNKENPYLKDTSLTIEPNSITAITGKVGSDKNGVFDLLLRLNRQHEGNITIDDIDIDKYNASEYYNLISSAREQPVFFCVSIKDNLKMINPNFEEAVSICKKLKIHDYIMNLKDGYDTVLTASADNINAIIKQLLSVARVLLKAPKIMLFYDTMDLFDKDTLDSVLKIMDEEKSDHTIVFITHNHNILKHADKVITIEDGICQGECKRKRNK